MALKFYQNILLKDVKNLAKIGSTVSSKTDLVIVKELETEPTGKVLHILSFTPFLISNAHFYKLLFFYKNYLKMYYYIVLVKLIMKNY